MLEPSTSHTTIEDPIQIFVSGIETSANYYLDYLANVRSAQKLPAYL